MHLNVFFSFADQSTVFVPISKIRANKKNLHLFLKYDYYSNLYSDNKPYEEWLSRLYEASQKMTSHYCSAYMKFSYFL